MVGPRLPSLYVMVGVSVLTLFVYLKSSAGSNVAAAFSISRQTAANSTLGFGGLFVVSGSGSPRRNNLIQSANVSELHFTIPTQPAWSDDQISAFRGHNDQSTITTGSVRAWLSHNLVLTEFLKSGLETALILEDDVDWDIRLRTQQVPLAAMAARALLPPASDNYYWGHPDDWELFYLGHCGDYFTTMDEPVGVGVVHPNNLTDLPHVIYPDPTLPRRTDMHPFTASLFDAFDVPERSRIVHKSVSPLCTFGYAVTRTSARRLVEEYAPVTGNRGNIDHAYDVAILTACRDKGLRCFTVNPELMHHMEGQSLISALDHKKWRPPVDEVGLKQTYWRGETSNIGCGFWSRDFSWNGDKQKLKRLREQVGRKGQCLKPGRLPNGDRVV
jgi:hypothetical protein